MKKLIRTVSLTLAMVLMCANLAYANEPITNGTTVSRDAEDKAIQPRGTYLGSAISEVTNEGQGVLSIFADFACYSSVPSATMTLTLQRRKSASSGTWSDVKTYTYNFYAKDEPDGELTYGSVDFEVRGLTTDYYYRVKGVHTVKTPSGSTETLNTQTDGVLLTSYPVYRSAAETK